MKWHNNLSDHSNNSYHGVVNPFPVFVLVGNCTSGTYVGRSQMFGNVYRRVTLRPGDEIHDLCGGVFVVFREGGPAHKAKVEISEKHPFEKVYLRAEEKWPVENLEPLPAGKKVGGYNHGLGNPSRREDLLRQGAKALANWMDYVFDDVASGDTSWADGQRDQPVRKTVGKKRKVTTRG